jgi:hypothetical protein
VTRADEVDWNQFKSSQIEIEAYSSAQGDVISAPIPLYKELGSYFWHWDPKKELQKEPEKKLKKELKNISDPVYLPPSIKINEVMRNLFVDFDLSDTKHFRKVWFKPGDDVRFRGLLGLHDSQKKRPLVIIRMGIYGNIDEITAERFLVRAVYDDLDANVLVLENMTSHGFLTQNKNISFGGVDEGILTFAAMSLIAQTPFNQKISGFHIVAISLGGQGTFVTALLDQANRKLLKSVVDFCPLINLRSTFEFHSRPGFDNAFADFWSSERLISLVERYHDEPGIADRWKTLLDFKPRFTPAMMAILNKNRHAPLLSPADVDRIVPGMKWPREFKNHIENAKDFYDLNDFWPSYQGVKTPIMIYTTPNDPLVANDLNSELIFNKKQPGDFSSVKFLRLDKGIHCGISSVYRWDYIIKLLHDGLAI